MEKIEVELPYINFDDPFPINIIAHDVKPLDEEKRMRVFSEQLMNDVIDNTKLNNFYFNIAIFFRLGEKLKRRFPKRKKELDNIIKN